MNSSRLLIATFALFTFALWADAQTTGGTTGGTTGSTTGGTTGGLTGGTTGGGFTGGGIGTSGGGGGAGNSFLDTGLGTTGTGSFLDTGYAPGALGHAGKAGLKTSTSADMFARYYVNPIAIGNVPAGSTTAISQFGLPLYSSLYPGTQITSPFTASSGTAGITGATRVSPAGAGGFGSFGGTSGFGTQTNRPVPSYTTSIGFKYQLPAPAQMQATVQAVLARSSDLPRSLEVTLDGPMVVLRGKVADPDQRRLAENLVKLTPGVKGVRNELEVDAAAKPGQ